MENNMILTFLVKFCDKTSAPLMRGAGSLSIKFILPPIGGRKSISRRKKGHFFAKKCPSSKNSPPDCF